MSDTDWCHGCSGTCCTGVGSDPCTCEGRVPSRDDDLKRAFKARECPDLHLGFWIWHDRVEDQHAAHTEEELEEALRLPGFDQDRFLRGASEMLDGVKVFWDGLWRDHLAHVGVAA